MGWRLLFLQEEEDDYKRKWERTPSDYYFARLAFMLHLVIRTIASLFTRLGPDQTDEAEFLVEFVTKAVKEVKEIAATEPEEDEESKPLEERAWYKRALQHERAWCMGLGIDHKEMLKL